MDRRSRSARTAPASEFQNLDTNRDGFVERAEAEALVHSEFNQYDTDRDNKVTEPEVRLIVQRSLAREAAERQQIEARRRQGMAAINDFIDMQLREADKLDKNNDGKLSQQEYAVLAGPADGPQTQGLLPYDIRRQLVMRKFQEIDTNKDGQLDRVELTSHAVKQFLEMDINKDRFLTEEEFKKAQEAETKKMRAIVQAMQPAQPAQPRPAPGPAARRAAHPAPAAAAARPGARPAAGHAVGGRTAAPALQPLHAGLTTDEAPFRSNPLCCGHCDPAGGRTDSPPAKQSTPPAPNAPPAQHTTGTPVPLPQWFVEIDIAKKGEVTRAEFLKYRMTLFEQVDVNKDGKLTLDEFMKVAEPPFSADVPDGPTLEERRNRARSEFQNSRHQPERPGRTRRGRGGGPFRVQPVRHGPRQQGDRTRGSADRAALDGARGRRTPAGRGAPSPGHAGDQRFHRAWSWKKPTSSTRTMTAG